MASPPADHLSSISPRAQELISTLNLTYLPKESGYIGVLGCSQQEVIAKSLLHPKGVARSLRAQSHNYYMLTSTLPTNYLHWLESDDTHILVEGGPVDYFIFNPSSPGTVEKLTLGMELQTGQRPVVAARAGCWKALKLHDGVDYALMVNVLSPEFTEDRVRIGEGGIWVEKYKMAAAWATDELLRELIGANWVAE